MFPQQVVKRRGETVLEECWERGYRVGVIQSCEEG